MVMRTFVPPTAWFKNWWAQKLIIVLMPAVLLIAGLALVALNTYADDYRRGEVSLARVKSGLEHLSAVDAEATMAAELSPHAAAELQSVEDDLSAHLAELTTLAVPERGLERVRRATLRYQGTVDSHLALMQQGQVEEAARVRANATELADEQADDAIDAVIDTYAHEAEYANRLASLGSLLMLLIAGGSIAGLLIRSGRAAAGAARLAGELSARKAMENELAHRAYHDTLTELPNRAFLEERLSHALARDARMSRCTAIMFIDLDDFKLINDTLGHQAGDDLLVTVAQRLRAGSRAGDTPARLGGDEFVMLLEDLEDSDVVDTAAARVLDQLSAPVVLAGREAAVCASVGIAVSEPGSPTLASDMLRQADVALYVAKGRGKSQFARFDPSMNQQPRERLELQADLRRALEHRQLRLHYQTIVELETGCITGVEALMRWQHPERGLIPPEQFIAVAEESGLIVPLGRWVLNAACSQAEAWRQQCLDDRPMAVSVNLSARQFQHPGLLADVASALQESGLPAHLLKLEITETAAMKAGPGTIHVLQALKGLGVRLAIDDFGTGYSSLAYLKRFPVDTLKIDRIFIEGLGKDPQDTAIVQSVMKLAQTLDLTVTAEGIETVDQLEELRAVACAEGQGYLFARPLPPNEVVTSLFTHRGARYQAEAA